MDFREILRLILPLISIVMGFVIKNSNNQNYTSVKKYWLFFVIAGTFMFLFKLYKYLK